MATPMDSMEQEGMCEIEATVVTGFECLAKEEIIEKFNVEEVKTNRGKVNFLIPVTKAKEILQLSSIDNAYVVIKRIKQFPFADTVAEVMQQFRVIVADINWDVGLNVWRQFFSFDHPISPQPQTNYQLTPPPSSDQTVQETDTKPATQTSDSDPAEVKKAKLRDSSLPAFRATCYRSGKHIFQSPDAARVFGGEVQSYFGWNVDMKKFDIEVVLTVESHHVYVSIALTRESLHRRNIEKFGPTTLRPTIAYNILRFCRIKELEVVCDPMCGGGSIPLEAALNWPRSVHLCGDNYDQAPPRTQDNLEEINNKRKAQGRKAISASVFQWDACNLPLKDESVDVFVTDMPFGKRSGSKTSNWHLYPKVLTEMARVCKRETGRVCVLTQDRKCLLKSIGYIEGLLRRGPVISTNIGGLAAAVFLFFRTSRKYTPPEEHREAAEARRRQADAQTLQQAEAQTPQQAEAQTPQQAEAQTPQQEDLKD